MLRLRTFGGLSVEERAEAGATGTALQRRPLALLAIVAAACGQGCRRDDLLLYLWPESTPERARNVLKQTLYALRRDLKSPNLFLTDRETIRLNPAVISTDVGDFEAAFERGDLKTAVDLYRGKFLENFHLKESPEFERWREGVRAQLAQRFAGAAQTLALQAAEVGDTAGAIEFWRRLAIADPLNPEPALGIMRALATKGDLAGALQHYRVHEALVQGAGLQLDPRVSELLNDLKAARSPRSQPQQETPAPTGRPRLQSRFGRFLTMAGALLLGLVLLLVWRNGGTREPADTGSGDIVVAPFRVVSADPALLYLREGMMDLLAAQLSGEPGPRAISPRSVMLAWRHETRTNDGDLSEPAALRLSRQLRARHLLLGGLVGTSQRITITAAMLDVATGKIVVQAGTDGPLDSLPGLVNRLAGQLIIGAAGEARPELVSPISTSLPALRAYLAGAAAYRRAQYHDAIAHFEQALDHDTTFALAALRLAMTGYWLRGSAWLTRLDVAWRHRARLSRRDRVMLEAIAGPRYPATAFWSEDLAAAERAVEVVPDRPEVWFLLGDVFFHLGPGLGRQDSWGHADRAFRRALELDSSFTAPLEHLLELNAAAGKIGEAQRLARIYFGRDSLGEHADFLRWRLAVAVADTVDLGRVRRRFDQMATSSLLRIVGTGQLDGLAPGDIDRAATVLRSRALAEAERWLVRRSLHYLALNSGRARAAATEVPLSSVGEPLPGWARRLTVMDALFGSGDTIAAVRALQAIEGRNPLSTDVGAVSRAARDADLCVAAVWRLLREDHRRHRGRTARVVRVLQQPLQGEDSLGVSRSNALCAALLDAVLAQRELRPSAQTAIRQLDSLMILGPAATNDVETFGNLVVATLYEAAGDPNSARAALRRRPYQWAYGPMFLATFLRKEGQLAERVGDRDGAITAYRHYLALRTAPDSALIPEVVQVRRELAQLTRSEQH